MNCVDWQERIALHAGGDAPPNEAALVERHIAGCPGCQVFWSGVRESLEVLREAHGELPDAAHFTAVRSRVMAELEQSRSPWRRLAWISGLAAMLLVVALWPRGAPPVPPRMAAVIPSAPLVKSVQRVQVAHRQVVRQQRAPMTIQLQTSDPNIVIYWIAD